MSISVLALSLALSTLPTRSWAQALHRTLDDCATEDFTSTAADVVPKPTG